MVCAVVEVGLELRFLSSECSLAFILLKPTVATVLGQLQVKIEPHDRITEAADKSIHGRSAGEVRFIAGSAGLF